MRLNRILRKEFFITLLIKQNRWHRYGVLIHTLAVVFHTLRAKRLDMIAAALLHDLGKPLIAYKKYKNPNEYSFTNHEELSYQLIKFWPLSSFTKKLVRYHYLLRGMQNSKNRNQIGKYKRMKRSFDKLDEDFVKELKIFAHLDDLGKK